jgi:hypothetical protein
LLSQEVQKGEAMQILKLKCESNQGRYDQTVREVVVEREDHKNWYGKPVANPACPTLQWPKYAWKEVDDERGQESGDTLA